MSSLEGDIQALISAIEPDLQKDRGTERDAGWRAGVGLLVRELKAVLSTHQQQAAGEADRCPACGMTAERFRALLGAEGDLRAANGRNNALIDIVKAGRLLRDGLRRDYAALVEALGYATPWPIDSVLTTLCAFAETMLYVRGYDGHNHEELKAAAEAGRKMVAALASAPALSAREQEPREALINNAELRRRLRWSLDLTNGDYDDLCCEIGAALGSTSLASSGGKRLREARSMGGMREQIWELAYQCSTGVTTPNKITTAILALREQGPTLADLRAWLRSRPGASWVKTLLDVEEAVRQMRAAPEELECCVCCDAPAREGLVTCAEHAAREEDGKAALRAASGTAGGVIEELRQAVDGVARDLCAEVRAAAEGRKA